MNTIGKSTILLLLVLLGFSGEALSQLKTPFTPRYSETINGNYQTIGNNMLSRDATAAYDGTDGNHDFIDNVYVDIDSDPTTFNSSSANMSNPAPTEGDCLVITKAFLYWAAADKEMDDGSDNQPTWNFDDVKLMLPGSSSYVTLDADDVIFRGRDEHFVNDPYICFKDITSMVQSLADPFGTYQVANVEAKAGDLVGHLGTNVGTSGGWQIVFVYEAPSLNARNVTLFDGYGHVTRDVFGYDIDFDGFQTVDSGAVRADVLFGALEGDFDIGGDRMQIQNTSGTFVDLSTPSRAADNFFDSSITNNGVDFLDRNPASRNTLGYDIGVFRLSNPGNSILDNNQSRTSIRLTSNQETYGLYLLGLSVEVFNPDLDPILLTTSVTGDVSPGSTFNVDFGIENTGNDNVQDLTVSYTVPAGFDFESVSGLPTGVTFNYDSGTRLLEFYFENSIVEIDDPAVNVQFQLSVPRACAYLGATLPIQVAAEYAGEFNTNVRTVVSSSYVDECGVGNLEPSYVTIEDAPDLDVTSTVSPADCFGAETGAIDVTVTGGTPPYTFMWSTGETTEDLADLAAGTYELTVTDLNDCKHTQSFTITQPDDFHVDIEATNGTEAGSCNDGTAKVIASGGTEPYSYQWSASAGSQTTQTATNLPYGVHTVVITDANGCTFEATAYINCDLEGWSYDCGEEVEVDEYGYNANCMATTVVNIPEAANVFQYIVEIVYDSSNPGPAIEFTDGSGTTQTLIRAEVDAPNNEWVYRGLFTGSTNSISYSDSSDNCDLQSVVVYAFRNVPGSLSATFGVFTDADGNNSLQTFDIPIATFPTARDLVIEVPVSELTDDGRYLLVRAEAGGVSEEVILYGPDSSLPGGACCLAIPTFTLNGVPGATSTVTITLDSRNGQNGQTVNGQSWILSSGINVETLCYDPIAITLESQDDILCFGDSTGRIEVAGTGGVPPYSYSANGGTPQSSPIFEGLAAGVYTIEIEDALGNTATVEVTLTQPEPLSIVITKENATTAQGCADGEATATPDGGTAPYTYLWSASAGSQTTATAINLPSGTHTVTVTDANGCELEQGVVIDCSNTCDAVIAVDDIVDVLCTGDDTGSATVSASSVANPGATFTFTWDTTPPTVVSGATSSTLTGLTAGIYTVSVTIDGTVCLPVEQSVTVTEPASALNVSATATDEAGPTTGDGTATAVVTGGTPPYTYSWSPGGETTEGITGLSAGDYTVTVTDANGCVESATVTVNPGTCLDLAVTATSTPVTCNGDSDGTVSASVTGGSGSFTYLWSTGDTTASVSGLAGGSYTVTVTDTVTLCEQTATTTVDEPNVLDSGIAVTNVLCFGESTGSLDLTVTGGTAPYTFAWSTGDTTEDISGLPAGTYNVTITDANGCVANDTATISQPLRGLEVSIDSQSDIVCSGLGSVTVAVIGGTAPYSYNIDGGAYGASATFSDLAAGDYVVGVLDANGCTITIDVSILFNCTDAIDDINNTFQDTAVSGNVLTNDEDFEGDTQTVTGNTAPANGTVVVNPDGTYTYTPNPGYTGEDSFTYTIVDDGNPQATDTATVYIEVLPDSGPENEAPIANADTNTTEVDTPVSGTVLANDYDPDGDPIVVTGNTTPANGTVVVNPDGTYTYTPNPGYTGEDTFEYTICDNGTPALCDTAVVTITINDDNGNITVANDDAYNTTPDTAVSGNVSDNDFDPEGDNQTVNTTPVSGPSNGTLVLNADGSFEYTPNAGFEGTDQFVYSVCDDGSPVACDQATVYITVGGILNTTDAIDDINNTFQDTAVSGNVLTNDEDFEGDTQTVTGNTAPANGTVVVNPDGTYTYTPNPGYTGEDSFTYTIVDDGNPQATDTATVYIEVLPDSGPENEAPVANADTNTTEVDTPVSGTVLANDYDPDGDPIVVTGNTTPANGTVVVNPDGTYTYTPNPGYTGEDTFEYTICDNGTPALCDTAVVTITINDDNGNITVANDDAYNTTPDTAVSGNVSDNDFDPEGDNQTVNTTPVSGPSNGTLVLNADGSFEYTPNAGFEGTDQFVYSVCDDGSPVACDQATVYITVGGILNTTDAIDDINNTFQDTAVSGNVLTNDEDFEGDTQTVTGNTAPANGTVVVNPDGTYTYTPNPGYTGEDSFTYTIVDDGNPQATDTATVYIEVLPDSGPENEAPVANADTNTTEVDTPVSGTVLANDYDPDGDPIVVTGNTTPANGTVVVNPDGTYTYTPNPGYTGEDTFEYTICDNGTPALCDTAVVTITINDDNGNITVANDDAYNTTPDTAVSGNVSDNDFDPEGDNQTVNTTPVSGPSNGTLVLNADGSFEYTPNPGFEGTDQFVYSVCDDGSPVACDEATVYITVGGILNTTDAIDDINNTFQDTAVSGNVLTNDEDFEGDTQTVTGNTAPANGTVVVNPDGTYTYTPNPGYTGEDSFTYTIVDDGNPQATDTATVYIEVLPDSGPENEAPIANADTNTTEVDTPVSGTVLANDYDPDGDPIVVTGNTTPANGTVVVNPDGTYTYTPNPGYTGEDTFEYTICDNGTPALCDTAVVTITINDDNGNITVANDDAYNTTPDTAVSGNVSDNDFDPEGDNQTVNTTPVSGPSNGTLVLNADGSFEYTPNAGFEGTDQFVYSVCDDGSPVACDEATVYITVGGILNTTDAIDDINNTFQDTAVSGNVLTNDEDFEGDTQTVTGNTAPANGTVVVNPDGTYTYTPNPGYTGEDSFTYTIVDDGNPQATDTATVYIEVLPDSGPENEAPIANADTNTTEVDTPVSGTVLANDYDPDGDPIVVTGNTTPANGTVVVNPDGTYTYTPNPGYTGEDTFEYTICDNGTPALCDTAVVTITINDDNGNITVANDDAYNTTPDTAVSGNVSDNDFDPEGDNQTVNTTPVSGPSNGTLVLNADGSFEYTPNPGFEGTDQFVYSVCDDGSPVACDEATVYITVGGILNTTDAIDDINNTFQDTAVSGNVLTNDEDFEGDTQTVTGNTAPANGTVVVNPDGTYTYTPNPGYTGEDSFTYTIVDDGNPQATDTATVYIEVLPDSGPENEAPIANADTNTTEVDTPVSGTVLANDYDPDGDPIVVTGNTTPANGTVVVNPDGTYTYTPNPGYTGEDTFEYTICDNGTPALCDTAVVTITINDDNGNITVANDDAYNTTPDTAVSGNVSDNDFDPEGDNQTVNTTPVSGPSNGTLVLNADGSFEYTPNAGFEGTDQFVYSVCDDGSPVACDEATVYITVGGILNTTDAIDDINNTFQDTAVSGNVLTNDEDFEGDTQTVTGNTAPANGTVVVNPDGTYTYTPNPGYTGEDSFTYTIVDDGNPQATDTATVYIEVLPDSGPENEAPIANADTNTTEVDTPVSGTVLANDYDPDGDPIVVTGNTTPANGTVVVNPDGTYTYTPNPGYTGEDTFEYTICDNGTPALCDTAVVTITINDDNGNITVANDDAYNTTPDTAVSGNVSDNDFDPEGDNQTVNTTPVSGPSNGTLVLNADGSFEYTPNAGFEGTDQFVYSVCDDGSPVACDEATVYITVGGILNTTDAIDDINNTFQDTAVSGNVLTNDEDFEGDTQTVTGNTAPANGTVVVNPDRTYTYTPNPGYTGEDSFTYTIVDDGNPQATDTATVYIEVLPDSGPENEAPIANADTNTTEVDTPVSGTVLANDYDPDGDPIVVTGNTTPANGTVVVNPDGTYTYTPNPGYTGEDTFEYTICDNGTPALCDTAVVTITINDDNGNITVANDDAYNTTPDTAVSGNVSDNDFDPEGDNQTVNTTPVSGPSNGTLVLNADGSFEYTPNAGFEGTDQFVYSVCDDGSPVACDEATVYITVSDRGNTILAIDDINDTFINTPVSGQVLTNDENADGPAGTEVVTLVTGPANGTLVLNSDGTYTYTPDTDFVGEDTFEYQVCDGGNPIACDTAIVTIEVVDDPILENDPPVANNDTNTTEVDTPVSGTVLANDYDMDGDPIVVTGNTDPANGTVVVNPDGTYTYTPNPGYTGEDTFEYTICDNGTPALCDTAVVTITITDDSGNITVANDDAYSGEVDTPINGSVLDNDNDPEGDNQTVSTTVVSGPANGTVVINPDGTFTYTPAAGYVGPDQFVYSVCDDGSPVACDEATVYLLIRQTPAPAIALVKSGAFVDGNGNGCSDEGEVVAYTFTVTNQGNVPLASVTLTDPLFEAPNPLVPIVLVSGDINGDGILDIDETWVFEADYAITTADVNAGSITNQAAVAAIDPDGTEVNDLSDDNSVNEDDPTVTGLCQASSMSVIKNQTSAAGGEGDVITYDIVVTNTGNTTLTNIEITDDNAVITGGNPIAELLPGASATVTAEHVITQDDIDLGYVENIATALGDSPDGGVDSVEDTADTGTDTAGNPIPDPETVETENGDGTTNGDPTDDPTVTVLEQNGSIAIVKTSVFVDGDGDACADAGETITYTFTVTNTGNVTLNSVVVNDPLLGGVVAGPLSGDTDGDGLLDVGEVWVYEATYTVTQDDIDAGNVTNQATVEALDPQDNAVSDDSGTAVDTDDATVTELCQNPAIAIVKTGIFVDGNGDDCADAGETIEYTFVVTNEGNVSLSGITVTDILVAPITFVDGDTDGDGELDVDETWTYTGVYTITAADIDAGEVVNQATAEGTAPDGTVVSDESGTTVDADDATVTELCQNPAIAIVKTGIFVDGNGDDCADAGETIEYTFVVTNEGNVSLSGITVTDILVAPITFVDGDTDGDGELDVDETWTYTGVYTITADDIDAGEVVNQATAEGTAPDGTVVSDESGTTVDADDATVTELCQNPAIAIVKTGIFVDGNGDDCADAGETIEYTFVVTNEGNVSLSGITVTDILVAPITFVDGDTDGDGELDVDETWTYTGTYTITADDIDAGEVVNQATAEGTAPDGTVVSDESGTTVDADDATVTELCQNPAIAIVKTGIFVDGNGDDCADAGETIEYTFVVTNEGNVSLSGITVTDILVAPITFVDGDTDGDGELDVDETWTYTGVYMITAADIDAGEVVNQATAEGTAPDGTVVSDESGTTVDADDATVTELCQNPAIAIVKTGIFVDGNGDDCADAGETIEYTFVVTNEGNVSLSGITVTDILVAPITFVDGDTDGDGELDVDETWTYTGTYTITAADIDAGEVVNQATAEGTAPDGTVVSDESGTTVDANDATVTELCQNPAIAIVKTGIFVDGNGDDCADAGETIEYTFVVTNEGNVSLSGITVTDILVAPITFVDGDTDGDGELDVDETWTYTGTYTITAADIDAGEVVNQATAEGTAPDGTVVSDESGTTVDADDATVTELCQNPAIAIVKTGIFVDGNGDDCADAGETIEYTFVVTNEGNVSLSGITVTDILVAPITFVDGDTDGDGELDVDETWTYTGTYTITAADIDAGEVVNQATAEGTAPDGTVVSDESGLTISDDDPTITKLCQEPSIAIIKEGVFNDLDGDGCADVKETITYTFTVVNTGNVTLTNINVIDPDVAVVGGPLASLAAGESDSTTFTATYLITQADIDAGFKENQAEVTGVTPLGGTVSDLSDDNSILEDDITVTDLCQAPSIALIKVGTVNDENGDGCTDAGETITYQFFVTNTGNVTLTNVTVVDPMVAVIGGPVTIAAGETDTETFTAVYTVTLDDVNNGFVMNQAEAFGTAPDGTEVSDLSDDNSILEDDPTETNICQDGSISVEKVGVFNDENGDDQPQPGETITYTFVVTNTGNVTVYDITIDDPLVPVTGGPITLEPGEVDDSTFTATYAITEEDIENGEVINQAIATGVDQNGNEVTDESDDPNDPTNRDNNGDGDPDDPTVVVLPDVLGAEFEIFNGITPDGDGLNDYFQINGIEQFPNNNMQIFNRWGVLVFETDNYGGTSGRENVFEGISKGRVTIREGKKLPTGTYYYVLRRFVDGETLTNDGYLYINNQ